VNWTFTPQYGDLTFAQAGFQTSLGEFSVSWEMQENGSACRFDWDVPESTRGVIVIPGFKAGMGEILMDQNASPPLTEGNYNEEDGTWSFGVLESQAGFTALFP
jgi:hypothetical protein